MVKTKAIKEAGQVLKVDDDSDFIQRKTKPKEIIEVSYSEAKKLAKRPMSDKQKENVSKLVEANRLKWEAKKQQQEDAQREREEEEDRKKTTVVVKPKRVYPPRKKQAPKEDPIYEEEEYEDETDEEDEIQQAAPPKKLAAKKQQPDNTALQQQNQQLMQKLNKLKQIDEALIRMNPAENKYFNLLKNRW